jgi:tRNA G18 (ribose-2'-O)-methylase SpoU
MSKKQEGYPVVGVETIRSSLPFSDFDWPASGIVVFGNEEYGISTPVRNVCDTFVHIPMFGHKNSLNVACAVSAIAFRITAELSLPSAE